MSINDVRRYSIIFDLPSCPTLSYNVQFLGLFWTPTYHKIGRHLWTFPLPNALHFTSQNFKSYQLDGKKWNKEHQALSFQFFINKSTILMFFVLFFRIVCKISILTCEPQRIWRKLLVMS